MKKSATLFVDESGKSSLLEKAKEPFILTGITMMDEELSAVEGFFNYIKRKFEIPVLQPFHSYHIFEHPNLKLPDAKSMSLADSLAEYISLIPVDIRVVEIDKSAFREALGIKSDENFKGDSKRKEMKDYPYRIMASYLFALFGAYLEKNDCIGQILADSRKGGDHQLLKTLHMCKEKLVPFRDGRHSEVIKKRVQAICFAEKGYLSGGLEIADLISYVTFLRARRMISSKEYLGMHLI